MVSFFHRGFAGGVISRLLWARQDTTKVAPGAARLPNMVVLKNGSVANRTGLEYVGTVKASANTTRVLPWIFADSDAYVLEAGDLYLRFWSGGSQILATGVLAYSAATNYAVGDLAATAGPTTPFYYCIKVNGPATTVKALNQTAYWYPLTTKVAGTSAIYEVPTLYPTASVARIGYSQSADVMNMTHTTYPVQQLTRFAFTDWTMGQALFRPSIDPPTAITVVEDTGSDAWDIRYKVTAISKDGFEESLPGHGSVVTVNADGLATGNGIDVIVTKTAHGLATGDEVVFLSVTDGSASVVSDYVAAYFPLRTFTITISGLNIFTLDDTLDSGPAVLFLNGTYALASTIKFQGGKPTGTSNNHIVSWTKVDEARSYNVYRNDTEKSSPATLSSNVYGYVGTSKSGTYTDQTAEPDYTAQPPEFDDPFNAAGKYPSVSTYFQQRFVLAGTTDDPTGVWLSRIGSFDNFCTRSPLQDDDSITLTVPGSGPGIIRGLAPLEQLCLFLSSGEWIMQGDASGVIKPSSPNLRQQSYEGSSTLRPLVIGGQPVWVGRDGNVVYDADFTDGGRLTPRDLTVLAPGLFDGFEIVDWFYAQRPDSTIYAIRDDGAWLCLAYDRVQDIWAWSGPHTTDGLVKFGCAIPEDGRDTPYFVVLRNINGSSVRYIERLAERKTGRDDFDITSDAFYVDAGASYDGTNKTQAGYDAAATLTLSGGTWGAGSSHTLTASTGTFANVIGSKYKLYDATTATWVIATLTAWASTTSATVTVDIAVPAGLQAIATSVWATLAVNVTGATHLNGETVAVLADGVASTGTISAGTLATPLTTYARFIHIGLPYTAELETLNADAPQADKANPLLDRIRTISGVSLLVQNSRGWAYGVDTAQMDTYSDGTTNVVNGTRYMEPRTAPSVNASVIIRQAQPLPLTVLGLVETFTIDDGRKVGT